MTAPSASRDTLRGAPPATLPIPVLRAVSPAAGLEVRSEGSAMPTMVGHFSVFSRWYEVNSWIEGRFLERIAPGTFGKTIAESRNQMKVMFDHGMDPTIGNKVLGPIEDLREDEIGAFYAVPLLDTSYNRDLRPALEEGLYGSSFRFVVPQDPNKDVWDMDPERSDYNPEGLPERTIKETRVFEFGPVAFPANPDATSGVRSITDRFYEFLERNSPDEFEELVRSATTRRTPAAVSTGAASPSNEPPDDGTPRSVERPTVKVRAQAIQRAKELART